jgi:hydroxypyruvate reductase
MTAPDPRTHPHAFLEHLYRAAVHRALPLHNTAAFLPPPPRGRTVGARAPARRRLDGAGGRGPVAGRRALSGLVVTRYHHIPPRPADCRSASRWWKPAHPVPDAAGLQAAERILALTRGLTADDLVLCLISGGGSALLTLPAEGLTLEEKQRINRDLLNSGANIVEMNCVRKHLSRIKGGRLAAACAPGAGW